MKRIIVLLTVALLMAAMMAASTLPAFAVNDNRLKACDHPGADHVPFCPIVTITTT
jgi:hypothetical protein